MTDESPQNRPLTHACPLSPKGEQQAAPGSEAERKLLWQNPAYDSDEYVHAPDWVPCEQVPNPGPTYRDCLEGLNDDKAAAASYQSNNRLSPKTEKESILAEPEDSSDDPDLLLPGPKPGPKPGPPMLKEPASNKPMRKKRRLDPIRLDPISEQRSQRRGQASRVQVSEQTTGRNPKRSTRNPVDYREHVFLVGVPRVDRFYIAADEDKIQEAFRQEDIHRVACLHQDAKRTKNGVQYEAFMFDDAKGVLQDKKVRKTIKDAVQWCIECLEQGNKVAVQCQQGINRSSLVAVLVMQHFNPQTCVQTRIQELKDEKSKHHAAWCTFDTQGGEYFEEELCGSLFQQLLKE